MSDPATLAFYEARGTRYLSACDGNASVELAPFLARLAPAASVLELGCGGGRDAAELAAQGFSVDATDGSEAMVEAARMLRGIAARRMLFEELDAVAAYDAVWAQACLIHVPRAELPRVLSAVCRALRPGGWHFASFKLGTGEGRDPLGRLTNFPGEGWLAARYREAGFRIEDSRRYRGEGADGVVRDWCALTVQKPG